MGLDEEKSYICPFPKQHIYNKYNKCVTLTHSLTHSHPHLTAVANHNNYTYEVVTKRSVSYIKHSTCSNRTKLSSKVSKSSPFNNEFSETLHNR